MTSVAYIYQNDAGEKKIFRSKSEAEAEVEKEGGKFEITYDYTETQFESFCRRGARLPARASSRS